MLGEVPQPDRSPDSSRGAQAETRFLPICFGTTYLACMGYENFPAVNQVSTWLALLNQFTIKLGYSSVAELLSGTDGTDDD